MNYYLMQQNNGIANIDINIQTGRIVQINEIYSFERLPVFTTENNFNELKDSLNKWISHRSISESRKDLPQILHDNHVRTPEALALKTLGLSLSDQYWFRPENTMYNWLNVNLYDNNFKQMKLLNTVENNLSASDSTLNGQLTKYWKIENDTRYLFKQSTFPFMQQAYNEVFASELLKKMKIPHVTYSIVEKGDMPYSVCPMFTDRNTEYVPAGAILDIKPKLNNESAYIHFMDCVNTLHIPVEKSQIDTMLAFDYLINNSDRHYGNFGFLRNAETMKFIGMAPLFDHGNSMWFNNLNYDIKLSQQPAKPFKDEQEAQIKLAKEQKLPTNLISETWIKEKIEQIYTQNPRCDQERRTLFFEKVLARKRSLEMSHTREKRKNRTYTQDYSR